MSDSTICGCIPRCCMVLRQTESVKITMWSERKLVHGPSLCLVQPCWYKWEKFDQLELFVNEYCLIENELDPGRNRYVKKYGINCGVILGNSCVLFYLLVCSFVAYFIFSPPIDLCRISFAHTNSFTFFLNLYRNAVFLATMSCSHSSFVVRL